MKYLMTFETFNSAQPSKGAVIEQEKEMRASEEWDSEIEARKAEEEFEEELEKEETEADDKKEGA
jgi:hypothetical protein